jgi:hypothetical protein
MWSTFIVDPTEPGMSGSPILDANGLAVGVVVLGRADERCGRQPILRLALPGWLGLPPRRNLQGARTLTRKVGS